MTDEPLTEPGAAAPRAEDGARLGRREPVLSEPPGFAGPAAAGGEAGEGADAALAARRAERLVAHTPSRRGAARGRFVLLVALALLVHAAIIAAFLYRDRHAPMQVVSAEEVPVEVVVEPPKPLEPKPPEPKPPEPPKPEPPKPPPPPKPPEPPKPKEDLSPAYSAPRAENKDTLKTDRLQEKTSAPKAAQPPSEGQPQPKVAAAPPKEAAPEPPKEEKEDSAKQDDKSDAEALDKARPKVAKPAAPKAAKPAPKARKAPDMMASLAGLSATPDVSFAKPTPKSKVYGGTEDVRWMSTVEGMLEAKVGELPRTAHFQEGGQVLICFHVDVSGRVTVKEYCRKSGYPDVDALAMRALLAAAPFPPPPPGIERGLVWSSVFDGQLPHVHISKR